MAQIKISLVGDVRSFVSSFKKGKESVEDLADEIEDLAKEGDDTEKSFASNFRAIERASDKAGRGLGRNMDDGWDKAGKGADDFKQEADQTAREVAASFDGSAESIAGGFQELAANALGGFGPAGAIAGLAAAAGIGLAVAGFQAVADAQALSEEAVANWADAYIEAGGRALTAGVLAARFTEILTDPEQFKVASKNAKDWGVNIETAVAAMAGDKGALDDVKTSVKLLGDALKDSTASEAAIDQFGQVNANLYAQDQAYHTAADSLSKLTGEMDAGATRASLLSGYYKDLINDASSATKEVDELGNELYTLPDGEQILIEADTGEATKNVSNFKGDVDGIQETVTTTVKVNVDDYDWRTWQPVTKYGRIEAYVMGTGRQVI